DTNSMLVKPSAAIRDSVLHPIRAHVLFLGVGFLGRRNAAERDTFYTETVGRVQPRLVIPVHWDDFFEPLSDHLPALAGLPGDRGRAIDSVAARARRDGIRFMVLQGYQRVVLFGPDRR